MFKKDLEKIRKSVNLLYSSTELKFEKTLVKKMELLNNNPYIYQIMLQDKNLRRFFIQKYVVIYKIEANNIYILRMLPQKSNYNKEKLDIWKLKF